MKKLLAIALTVLVSVFTFSTSAFAADAAAGAQVFAANCNACHIGGNNAVMPPKTLKEADLKTYLAGYKDGSKSLEEAVAYQVINGQGAMPAFGGRLSEEQIANVAAYVADQAEGNKW
ncbi:c-type cytochrome [[Limnothrix rosea] IAM M-220]|uniref:c-type cytochrome n=1 Tax=[Limnothrix rosea] IAM M-220 TaxID=454133 RepID=UPI00095DA75B|nr:c-type cytochrome [[Limnothrix rosea] IAM M-220]OKH18888.1 cytochrome C6 [[Limnothrix rosea] IAM M-220]